MDDAITRMLRMGPASHAALMEAVYPELRRKAARYLRAERPDHTLQPTALANEAWIRLGRVDTGAITNRGHFFALASTMMRRILKDHARTRNAQHNCGRYQRADMEDNDFPSSEDHEFRLAMEAALDRLKTVDPRLSGVVTLRFVEGLTEAETGERLGIAPRTVRRDWRIARAWLRDELRPGC